MKFEDDSDRAIIYGSPTCSKCVHLQGHMICAAFPNGIPEKIWNGGNDHTEPYPGDHGLRFEPRKQVTAKKAAKEKKLIRFQLPHNPTDEEIDELVEWIKTEASNAKPSKKED